MKPSNQGRPNKKANPSLPQLFKKVVSPEVVFYQLPTILKMPRETILEMSTILAVRVAQIESGYAEFSKLGPLERGAIYRPLQLWAKALKELAFPERYSARSAISWALPAASPKN